MVSPLNWFQRKRQRKAKMRTDMVKAGECRASTPLLQCGVPQGGPKVTQPCKQGTVPKDSASQRSPQPCKQGTVPQDSASQRSPQDIKSIPPFTNKLKPQSSPHVPVVQILFGNPNDDLRIKKLIISCPEKSKTDKWLVELPSTLLDLQKIGYDKFGFYAEWIVAKDGTFSILYPVHVETRNPSKADFIENGEHLMFIRSKSKNIYGKDPISKSSLREHMLKACRWVSVSCPEKSKTTEWYVSLPESFGKLVFMGAEKFGFIADLIISRDRPFLPVKDISSIRDGDLLVFVRFKTRNPRDLIIGADSGVNGKSCRVVISCPEKSNIEPLLVLLPATFTQLLELGVREFGICAVKIISKEHGSRINNIDVIRNDDHLVFVSAFS